MPTLSHARRSNQGFTLVELMIALLIGLFIVGGLMTLMFSMRRNTASQSGLSQLQDNQRMAMNIIAGGIQSAGYYPDPFLNWTSGAAGFFPVTVSPQPIFPTAGQGITGVDGAAGTGGDSLTVRYATNGTDNVLNCAGQKSTSAKVWTSTFSIVQSGSGANLTGTLQCVLRDNVGTANATLNLVTGITSMQVVYGVQTAGGTSNSIDAYLTATQMTPAYWNNVLSVRVTLTFNNPLAGQPGQTTVGATIPFTRVITLMNKTGVNT